MNQNVDSTSFSVRAQVSHSSMSERAQATGIHSLVWLLCTHTHTHRSGFKSALRSHKATIHRQDTFLQKTLGRELCNDLLYYVQEKAVCKMTWAGGTTYPDQYKNTERHALGWPLYDKMPTNAKGSNLSHPRFTVNTCRPIVVKGVPYRTRMKSSCRELNS